MSWFLAVFIGLSIFGSIIIFSVLLDNYIRKTMKENELKEPFKAGDKLVGKSYLGNVIQDKEEYFIPDKVEYSQRGFELLLWSNGSFWGCNIKDISHYVEEEWIPKVGDWVISDNHYATLLPKKASRIMNIHSSGTRLHLAEGHFDKKDFRKALPHEISQQESIEYVECITSSLQDFTKGGIYCSSDITKNTMWFKPSTKEAYEKQQKPSPQAKPVEKTFEVGKWYKAKTSNLYIKPKELTSNGYSKAGAEVIWNAGSYSASGSGTDNPERYNILTDLSEIQQYLPEGHIDKITIKKETTMSCQSMEEILEEAKRRYPIGTKIIGLDTPDVSSNFNCNKEVVISGYPVIQYKECHIDRKHDAIYCVPNVYLYNGGKWAEIVSLPEKKEESYKGRYVKALIDYVKGIPQFKKGMYALMISNHNCEFRGDTYSCILPSDMIEIMPEGFKPDKAVPEETNSVPEYVECILPDNWTNTVKENDGNLIFNTRTFVFKYYNKDWNYAYFQNPSSWKPSTKEAYDLQERKKNSRYKWEESYIDSFKETMLKNLESSYLKTSGFTSLSGIHAISTQDPRELISFTPILKKKESKKRKQLTIINQ